MLNKEIMKQKIEQRAQIIIAILQFITAIALVAIVYFIFTR